MSYQPPPSSDDALYALLGIPSTSTRTIEPIIHNTSLTRSTDSRSAAEVDDTETITRSEKKKKKTKRGGAVSRLRRTTEREAQRIALGEDSDEAIKDTAHTRVTHLADSRRPSDDKVEKKLELPQVNPYWMYGQGLEIPPYRASIKEEMKEEVKVEGDLGMKQDETVKEDEQVNEEVNEEAEIKEKDFADTEPHTATVQAKSQDKAKDEKADVITPRKHYKPEDLLNQLIESIERASLSTRNAHDLDIGNLKSDSKKDGQVPTNVKLEESVPMTKVPTSTTDEGLTTADESFHTDTDTEFKPKPRPRFHVVQHQSPIKGSTKRRIRYQVVRHISPSSKLDSSPDDEVEVKVEPDPVPDTPCQRDLQSTFSRSTLLQIEDYAKSDNTSGIHLPSHLRDLFPALAGKASAITIANHLRRQFDLPLLSTKTDELALIRAIANMRLGLYTELVSALILPSAPIPALDTDDEEVPEKKKKISLAPSALDHLHKTLPAAFPDDKFAIKLFLANQDPFGEIKGKVIWQDGIGTIVGGDPNGPAFRGKIANEGLVHVFVDQYVLSPLFPQIN
jgi:hypothetical protein